MVEGFYHLVSFVLVFIIIHTDKLWLACMDMDIVHCVKRNHYRPVKQHCYQTWVQRPRPCRDPEMIDHVRMLLNHCSGGNSFPSSHATNHFGAAVFIFCTLRKYSGNWIIPVFFWAASVSYGQIYVGVHYPLDVISGALIGSIVGYCVALIYNKKIGLPELRLSSV
jgi:undecaprenyl-diphosphatase